MAKAEINVEFPCGYKYHMKFDVGIFGSFSADGEEFKTCPLHGKNCPPKSRTKKSSPIKQLNNWLEKEWNKIIKTIVGAPCLVFLIASGVPLMTNEGLSRLIGFFNYFGGSILLYFILYKYFKMEEELKQKLTTEEEGEEEEYGEEREFITDKGEKYILKPTNDKEL